MVEKRYKSNKYIRCYCEKDEDVLVGIKLYRFVNIIFMIPAVVFFCVLVAIGSLAIITKVIAIICIIALPTLVVRSFYTNAKRGMLSAGHTEHCSRKVACLTMLYAGTSSEFKIMKNKES